MAVLNRASFFDRINKVIGENSTVENIQFLEDMTDTYNALENNSNDEAWEKKYHDLNEEWKQRYANRFFSGVGACNPPETNNRQQDDNRAENITFDDLFKYD